MINAKEVRNRFHLNKEINLKEMMIKYFEAELNKVMKYTENVVGPFGLSFSISLKNLISIQTNNQHIELFTITKKDIENAVNKFEKELEDSGYFVQWKYDKLSKVYIFAIYWTTIKKGE